MAFDSLETILKGNGPATDSLNAGVTSGQRQFEAEQKALQDAQTLRNLQQTHQQNADMAPLRLQHQALQNQGLEAGLGGITAESESKRLKAEREQQTQTSEIAKKLEENKSELSAAHLKTLSSMGQMAGILGTQLEGAVPGSLKDTEIKHQFMQEQGIHPDSTVGKYVLRADSQGLNKLATQIATTLPAYVQAMAVGKQQTESQQKIHAADRAVQLQIAREGFDLKRDLAEARAEADKHKAESKLANAKLEAKNIEASILAIPIAQRTPEQQAQLEEATDILNKRSGAAMGLNLESINPNFKSNASAGKAGGRKPLGDY